MTLDTTTGASLIAEQVSQILAQPREAASVVLAAGQRIFDCSEPLRIPTLTGSTPYCCLRLRRKVPWPGR